MSAANHLTRPQASCSSKKQRESETAPCNHQEVSKCGAAAAVPDAVDNQE